MNSTLSSPVVSQAQHTPFVMGSPLASPVVPQTQQTPFVMDSTLSSPVVSQIQQTPFVMGSTLSSPVVSQLQQSPLSMPQYEVSSSYTPLSVPFSPEPRTHVTFPTDYNNFTPSNGGMSANHEEDYKGLVVELVDAVESSYSQLEELNQLNTLTMRDVDFVNGLVPGHLKVEWIRKYHDMSSGEKIQPFRPFMKFLERERETAARLAENQIFYSVVITMAYIPSRKWQSAATIDLSIMKGELGVCLQGTHPDLSEDTKYDSNLVKTIHDSKIKLESYYDLIHIQNFNQDQRSYYLHVIVPRVLWNVLIEMVTEDVMQLWQLWLYSERMRGEVQKRTSGKAYGVIFTDMQVSSVRGWPEKIYSDPGSQLIGAGRELEEAWKNMDRQSLQKSGTKNGSTWIFGPADSPWYQGAVESLVKSAKRAIHFAVNNQHLSVPEFLTLCYEVSNLMNERPIGAQPSIDSTLNILTPNSLLLGRARAINPLGWQPHNSNIRTRYHLVQAVTEDVWKRWTELYAPTLIKD
ncbi:hypothetical protein QZH41_018918 [Actinostola sp. cb2023]|nr:hypothetical protein QZH41_018918 [Actinostola sp. cb2023]